MKFPPLPNLSVEEQRSQFVSDPMGLVERCFEECGDIFTLNLGVKREKNTLANGYWVFLTRPDQFKSVFKASPRIMHSGDASKVYFGTDITTGGLARLDEDAHQKRRRFLMPVFNGKRMGIYFDAMLSITERCTDNLPLEQPFQMLRFCQKIAIDIIIDTVFGIEDASLAEALASKLIKVENADYTRDEAVEFEKELSRIIYKHVDESLAGGGLSNRQDVCSMLLKAIDEESGDRLSKTDIHDELISLLKAGFATVSNSMAWAFEGILSNPDVTKRVYEELDRVLGTGPVTPESLNLFPFLEATLMESLRLRPLAAFNGVRLLTEPFELDGYQIPQGTILSLCAYLLHRRPELYPEPERFDPDRFLDQKMKPYSWLPFGGGVRLCIGKSFALQEMKIIIASVLSRFRLNILEPVTRPVWQGFFLSPEHGLLVDALPRKQEVVT